MRILAATAAVVLLTGCGALGGGDDEPSPQGSSTTADGEAGADDAPANGAGVAETDLDDVLTEQTVALARNPEDQVTIGVHSLVVDGPTMTLQLVLTPQFASESDSAAISLYDAWERDVFQPTLLDRPNLTEYSVITDNSQGWASDPLETEAVNGIPFLVFATFAAPQDDVETLELRLRDVWPVFTDVPVTT